jgi:hypothetical protein
MEKLRKETTVTVVSKHFTIRLTGGLDLGEIKKGDHGDQGRQPVNIVVA